MIPKKIHYCWFGGNPLPDLALHCIESWKKYCPDFEIIKWNETNFNMESCVFFREAYEAKEWAFMSDFARLKIIFDHGGIYLDTDVELLKPLNDLLFEKCFLASDTSGYIATGLGFGAEKNNRIIALLMDEYLHQPFQLEDGSFDRSPCPVKNTKPLLLEGYVFNDIQIWQNEDVVVYPPRFFSPLNYETKELKITNDTISIHWFNASWHTKLEKIIFYIESGQKEGLQYHIKRILSLPFRGINKLYKYGMIITIKQIINSIKKK